MENRNDDFNVVKVDMRRKGASQHMQNRIQTSIDSGIYSVKIIPQNTDDHLFPSMCVPVAGMIDRFRNEGVTFFGSKAFKYPSYLSQSGILFPKVYSETDIGRKSFLDCVIKFDLNNVQQHSQKHAQH